MMRRFLTLFLVSALLVLSRPLVSAGKDLTDDEIYDQVRRRLANDPDVKGGAFEVDVQRGVVTVKGVVEKDKFRSKAEKLIKKVKGVKGVVNQITVKSKERPR